MNRIIGWAVLVAAAGAVGASERFTRRQLEARFHYDLGPEEVDVSSYPEEQRGNYRVFQKTCSQCHTPARAINAPHVLKKDWERYVLRMHIRSKARRGVTIPRKDVRAIVEFLAYDSKLRKADRKAEFQEKDLELRRAFEELRKERLQSKMEQDLEKARTGPPYTGTK